MPAKTPLSIKPKFSGVLGPREAVEAFFRPLNAFLHQLGPLNRPGSNAFCADNMLLLSRNMSFLEDERFVAAVQENAADDEDRSIVWRTHVLCWAAGLALSRPGDFVECGTYRGYSAAVIARYHAFQDQRERSFYLYDTFNPAAPDGAGEGVRLPHHSDDLYDQVTARFSSYPNVRVVRGRIPEVFATACPERIAFLHVDLNDAAAEGAALDALFDRVEPFGAIVFDDYGWTGYRASRDTVRAFMAVRGQSVVELPTGQGLVIKT